MVYDGGVMRSILAFGLALLVLAAEAPGLFTETPVCAAVDGRGQAVTSVHAAGSEHAPAPAKSCCGTASCPMHATGCGKTATCPRAKPEATPAAAAEASAGVEASDARLCAPSCGSEGARVVPGVPDPGTLDPTRAPSTPLTAAGPVPFASGELPSRNPVPADPPPRV